MKNMSLGSKIMILITIFLCITPLPYKRRINTKAPTNPHIESVPTAHKRVAHTVERMQTSNTTNLTFLNMTANISVKTPGRMLKIPFSSPYEAISNITAEIKSENSPIITNETLIRNTSFFLYHDILQKLRENATTPNATIQDGNITLHQNASVPGHKLFFSRMTSTHPNFTTTYDGMIVPVNETEFTQEDYGSPYSKTFLYGSMPSMNLKNTDASFSLQPGHNLLVYFNSKSKVTAQSILQKTKRLRGMVNILGLDMNNNGTKTRGLRDEVAPKFPTVLDDQTSVPNISTENSSSFFGLKDRTPALIHIYKPSSEQPGLIWRKSIGIESSEDLRSYFESFTKALIETGIGSNVRPILNINSVNLKPDKEAKILTSLGTGFDEVTDYTMNVTILNKEKKVIQTRTLQKIDILKRGSVLEGTVVLPEKDKKPKTMIVNVEITSNGVSLSERREFGIKLESEEEPPWGVYTGIGITIAILIIGILLNRKYRGKKKK